MASNLADAGLCISVLGEDSGVYGGDILTEFRNDGYRRCETWDSAVQDYNSVQCAANLSITSSDGGSLFDPQRSLVYEDGMSVALFYGDNYQVEVDPVKGAEWTESEALSNCDGLVQSLKEAIGGSVTMLGEYDSAPVDNSSNSDVTTGTSTAPTVETVPVPNFIGQIDGQVSGWLIRNGYKVRSSIKSTGFNPKISCLMAGDNQIVDQSPAPGTEVENTSATSIDIFVDCEW